MTRWDRPRLWLRVKLYPLRRYVWAFWSIRIYPMIKPRLRHAKGLAVDNVQLEEAIERARIVEWRADGLREMGDAAEPPRWGQYLYNEVASGRPQPEGSFDCDGFASWLSHSLDERYQADIFCIMWLNPPELRGKDGLTSGHAMCRGHDPDTNGLFHIGNWKPRTDYRDMRSLIIQALDTALEWFEINSPREAEAVANAEGAAEKYEAYLLAWALLDRKTLRPKVISRKLPESGERFLWMDQR